QSDQLVLCLNMFCLKLCKPVFCCFSSGFQVRIVEVHQHLASVYVLAYVDKTLAYLATDLEGQGGSLTGARDAGKSQPGLLRARLYGYRAHRDSDCFRRTGGIALAVTAG